jgi:uncharacterized membrane protein
MSKTRLEAFSDGVLAIIITIMVLELKVPHGGDLHALAPLLPVFASYALSFVFVGIYWNNHHHLLHTCQHVSAGILWANLHLLFWLSLVPACTAWAGEYPANPLPAALYGVVFLLSAVAYEILQRAIVARQGDGSKLKAELGADIKGWASLALYLLGIPLAFVNSRISYALYVLVAAIWFIPDRRIEAALHESALGD